MGVTFQYAFGVSGFTVPSRRDYYETTMRQLCQAPMFANCPVTRLLLSVSLNDHLDKIHHQALQNFRWLLSLLGQISPYGGSRWRDGTIRCPVL